MDDNAPLRPERISICNFDVQWNILEIPLYSPPLAPGAKVLVIL